MPRTWRRVAIHAARRFFCTATARPRAELALKLKDAIAAEAKKRQVSQLKKGAEKPVVPTLAPRENGKTRDELAKMANVSHGTLAKVEKIIAGAAPEVVEATRKGEMSINAENRTQTRENAPRGARGSATARAEASPKTVPKLSQNCPKQSTRREKCISANVYRGETHF